MNLKNLFSVLFFIAGLHAPGISQTLFTYGKYSTDAKEFLRAFEKNNPKKATNKAAAMNEYLGQYTRSKLKTAEAYERRYDTLPNIKMEIANLRGQVVDNYMTDPKFMQKIVDEAFSRSQKDIRFAHIYISFQNDMAAADKKKEEVLARLKNGEDFMKVAGQISDDPSAKINKGDGGFITVFSLPYEFENAIYNTPVGKYSAPVVSKSGYHIFKKLGERKAIGKIKAKQILLAIPPGSDEITKKQIAARADSIYNLLLKGQNFGELAAKFSNDYISANNDGTMADIKVGEFDEAFEIQLLQIKKDGAFSRPFETSHGLHIVKRLSVVPVPIDKNNKTSIQELTDKAIADSRSKGSKDFIYKAVKEKVKFEKLLSNDAALWALSDSLLDRKVLAEAGKSIDVNTALIGLGKYKYDAASWISYAQANRYNSDGSGIKPYNTLWSDWEKYILYNYYRENLEEFNEEFRLQMKEFTDGNLFFEIMQQEVWNKAQSDTLALKNMYAVNMKKYMWNKSADAVIFFCSDSATAKDLYKQIKAKPSAWKTAVDSYGEKVLADSSRYELSQLPGLGKLAAKSGMVTEPVINVNDFTGSFTYIIKSNEQPIQKKYNEALGNVINDYQEILEKKIDAQLEKKFPVVIDKAVLQKISK